MKKKYVILIVMGLVMAMLIPTVALAAGDLGINGTWIKQQLKLAVGIITIVMVVLAFAKKETSKVVIYLLLGGIIYAVVAAPEGLLNGIGSVFKQLIGLE